MAICPFDSELPATDFLPGTTCVSFLGSSTTQGTTVFAMRSSRFYGHGAFMASLDLPSKELPAVVGHKHPNVGAVK